MQLPLRFGLVAADKPAEFSCIKFQPSRGQYASKVCTLYAKHVRSIMLRLSCITVTFCSIEGGSFNFFPCNDVNYPLCLKSTL